MKNYLRVLWAALLNRPIAARLVLRDTLHTGSMRASVIIGNRVEGPMESSVIPTV